MADITILPLTVIASPAANIVRGRAGVAIAGGQVLYLDPADNTYKLADANGASPLFNAVGIALNSAGIGQYVWLAVSDPLFVLGGPVIAGETLCLSATPGGICPDADVVTGDFKVILGIGISATQIKLALSAAGVVTP